MESNPPTEQKKIAAETLAYLHRYQPIEALIWDHWIETGQARLIEVQA